MEKDIFRKANMGHRKRKFCQRQQLWPIVSTSYGDQYDQNQTTD